MRNIIAISAILVLGALLSSGTASASDSSVNLSAPSTGILTFCTSAGDPVMSLSGFGGTASMGSGAFAGATGFTLSGAPLRFTSDGASSWQTKGTLTFDLTGTAITGTLSDIKITQVGQLVLLTGDLKSGSTNTQLVLVIDLPSGTSIAGLTKVELAHLSVGEGLETNPTPEPGTMILFGSGLLLVAGVLRRRKLVSAVA
jgi:PEP-CTERM motif